jgi:hypothetical protein
VTLDERQHSFVHKSSLNKGEMYSNIEKISLGPRGKAPWKDRMDRHGNKRLATVK